MFTLTMMKILFWFCIALVIYAYVGYGFVLYIMIRIKRFIKGNTSPPNLEQIPDKDLPTVTFVVAAWNEESWIEDKIHNCLAFNYPKEKLELLFVTDGSNDRTPDIIREFPVPEGVNLSLYHEDARNGKIAAVERIMEFVKSDITIFTDANTDVNPAAIYNIVRHYQNPKVGAVAGQKRIKQSDADAASGAGEGIYWRYENTLKKWDSELYSVVGGAGELFSIRTNLYEPVEKDSIIEDFIMTMRIAKKGYVVRYEPEAEAVETSSASVGEELKRKIRIAAGGLQSIVRLAPLLNIFKYGMLTFQYVSHRVLRWTLAPLALPIILILNIILAQQGSTFYQWILVAQIAFYILASIGYLLEKRKLKVKAFFVPYYFCVMNYAVYRGFGRFMSGQQSVLWEKAKRA